jgi:DnaJ-class molecular chaperone
MSVFASTAAASISTVIPPSGTVAQHAFGRRQQGASCSQVGRNCMWQLRGGDASPSNLNDTLKDALHKKDNNDSAEPTRKKKKRTKKRRSPNASNNSATEHQGDETADSQLPDTSTADSPPDPQPHAEFKKGNPKETEKADAPKVDPVVEDILKSDDYYDILGVHKTATEVEIKKSYRRRCVVTHPDKLASGDRAAFDRVSEAYGILGDDESRARYDRIGSINASQKNGSRPDASPFFNFGGGGGGFQEEILRSFFGASGSSTPGGGGFASFAQRAAARQHPSAPRNRNVRYELEVTLEDLYTGLTRPVVISQPGSRNKKQKRVEVVIPRGIASGESITLSGEVDYVETDTPADVTFILAQRPHVMFTRKGHDLAMELTVTLGEALCGFSRTIPRLDGKTLVLHSPRGAHQRNSKRQDGYNKERSPPIMIRDGDVHVLKGKGMPKRRPGGDGIEFGDLYVQYKVEMPLAKENAVGGKNKAGHLSMEEKIQLKKLLDKLEGRAISTTESASSSSGFKSPLAEEPCLEVASASDFGRASGPFVSERDNEDDSHLQRDEDGGASSSRNFQYFSSGSFPGRGFHQHQHFFGQGSQDDKDDGSNVQCQQM